MKTSELKKFALDWAVAKCEFPNQEFPEDYGWMIQAASGFEPFNPSTNWAQGGPIIERERICQAPWGNEGQWIADIRNSAGMLLQRQYGETPLIAAMRCYVAYKLGDEVEIAAIFNLT